MRFQRRFKFSAIVAVSALAMAACGDTADSGSAEDNNEVHIAYTAFDEGIAATFLWKHILEEQGYEVEVTLMDPGPVYAAVGQGDADLYLAGLPGTHHNYWDEYGDGFESIKVWYEPLQHGLTVPDYVYDDGFETIQDLVDNADQFNQQIVGIESGAGIMQEAEEAMETYGLSEYDLLDSSTAAMLAEFGTAVDNEEYIVATGWNPHWAIEEYSMEFLDDPEEIFNVGDQYQVIASEDAQQRDDLMSLFSEFEMNDDQLFSLLGELHDAAEENEEAAVQAWLEDEEHQQLVDDWVAAADVE